MTLRPISKTDEDIEDVVAALLAAGNGLDVTYDDENGTLTVDVSQNAIGTGELSFETATQDELDAVESSAADARTDLRFALYPEEVDASTRDSYYQNFAKFADSAAMTSIAASSVVMDEVSESETAMDAVSTSATAMDAVSTSSLAMDAVSTSSLAMDAIWDSQLAWDTVAAVAMAVGKFVAGRAGLTPSNYADIDVVASDQAAMDAVSTSATAMDAVSASLLASSAVLKSDDSVSSLWASTPGAKTILQNSGNKSLPYNTSTPGGDANITVDDGSSSGLPGSTAHQLYFDINGADPGNYVSITYSLDLSGSDTLELKEKAEGGGDDRMKLGVKIDGTQVFQIGGVHGYTTRSLDISTFNGTHDVEFFHENTSYDNSGVDNQFYIADIDLI